MKIESVKIENFRSYKEEIFFLENFTSFIGPNGSGKSTILYALNVFFRSFRDSKTDLSKLKIDDFHQKNVNDPIKITVTFNELSNEAKSDLKDYVRNDKLIISAVAKYDDQTKFAEVLQYGNRLGIKDFSRFFKSESTGAKVDDLKKIYLDLQKKFTTLPKPGSKQAMIDALHEYETNNQNECVIIPSKDQFYGATKGTNLLSRYIQWIFVPAIKDIVNEGDESKDSSLSQLLARTVRSRINFTEKISEIKNRLLIDYNNILNQEQKSLDELSKSIDQKIKNWSHPSATAEILWKQDDDRSIKIEEPSAYIKIGERGFESDLSRFGHGLQRSFLLAILQELVEIENENVPTLIMGIEEPELYQHPPQARYLSELLQDLAEKNSQILVCSHSPHFLPGDNIESIRIIKENESTNASYCKSVKYSEVSKLLEESGEKILKENGILAKLYPSLNPNLNEMFFCKKLILTEGIEDIAYIETYIHLTGNIGKYRQKGYHIVPVGGKSELIKPIALARLLEIPLFVVFDADTDKVKEHEINKHRKDNKSILNLINQNTTPEWPTKTEIGNNFTMWHTNITKIIPISIEAWESELENSRAYYGHAPELNKNPLVISRTLATAWEKGKRSQELIDLIERIISH